MYSLTVQGTHTGGFQFKHGSGHEFRSLVESLVLNYATLICSRYRIDLIYHSDQDLQEDIMKAWCKIVGKKFTSDVKRKFIRIKGHQETLENYFVSLIYLARIPDWFLDYKTQLKLTINQEPNHPIHNEIIGCALHLATQKDSIHLLSDTTDKFIIAHHLIQDVNEFAKNAALNYLRN